MINEIYLSEQKLSYLKKSFNNSKPFKHLKFINFFDERIIKNLVMTLSKEHFYYQDSDLFSFSKTSDFVNSKNKVIKEFYVFLNSKEFKDYLFKITNIKAYGKIDCSGFIYADKNYLLPHDDSLDKRKIAFVLNLSKDFKKIDGGSLDFFKDKKIVKSIMPDFNTFVIFKVVAGKTFHQVKEVTSKKNRISIAGWFNDK